MRRRTISSRRPSHRRRRRSSNSRRWARTCRSRSRHRLVPPRRACSRDTRPFLRRIASRLRRSIISNRLLRHSHSRHHRSRSHHRRDTFRDRCHRRRVRHRWRRRLFRRRMRIRTCTRRCNSHRRLPHTRMRTRTPTRSRAGLVLHPHSRSLGILHPRTAGGFQRRRVDICTPKVARDGHRSVRHRLYPDSTVAELFRSTLSPHRGGVCVWEPSTVRVSTVSAATASVCSHAHVHFVGRSVSAQSVSPLDHKVIASY